MNKHVPDTAEYSLNELCTQIIPVIQPLLGVKDGNNLEEEKLDKQKEYKMHYESLERLELESKSLHAPVHEKMLQLLNADVSKPITEAVVAYESAGEL